MVSSNYGLLLLLEYHYILNCVAKKKKLKIKTIIESFEINPF